MGLQLSKCRALSYHLFSQEIAIPTGDLVVRFLFASVLELESGNQILTHKQTDKKQQMELDQFQKHLSYDGDLSPYQVRIRLDKAFSS